MKQIELLKIRSGIPMPDKNAPHSKRRSMYPFREMKVGDSFPAFKANGKASQKRANTTIGNFNRIYKKARGKGKREFEWRKLDEFIQIWRVK